MNKITDMHNEWTTRMLESIEPIFQDLFLDKKLRISESTSPADIEDWDSLAHVSLLTSVEQKLKVRFTAEDMGSIRDVAGMLAILKERGA